MTLGRYLLGVAAAVFVFGGPWMAAVSVRRWLLPGLHGALARLAEAVLAVAVLQLTLQALGAVGLLSLAPAVIASVLVAVGAPWAAARLAVRHPDRQRRVRAALAGSGPPGGDSGPSWLGRLPVGLAVLGAGVVLAEWAGVTLEALHRGAVGFDSVAYHLPWAASFAHTGQITSIRYTDFDWLTGFYPATSELIQAGGIVVMHSDVLAPVFNLVWLALALLAAWCIGAPRGVGPATLLAGALVLATPTLFFSTPGSADSDAMGIFCVLAAAALWVNLAGRGDALALVPAAAATGLAIATKLNMVIAALAITLVALLGAPPGAKARVARVWGATLVVTGGFWYLRNLIAVGNPLPYFRFAVLPVPHPGPLQAPNNYAIWHYVPHLSTVWSSFHHALAFGLGSWWVELLAAAIVGPLLCLALGPGRHVRLLGLVGLIAVIGYAFTPGSASGPAGDPLGFSFNLRYSTPALALALTAAPLAAPFQTRAGRWLAVGFTSVLLLVIELDRSFWGSGYNLGGRLVTALVLLGIGVALVVVPQRWRSWAWAPVRVGALACVLVLALVGVALAYGATRTYEHGRYRGLPGHVPWVGMLWRWADTQHGQRIAMSGTYGWYFAYPVFGADASNTVVYLGQHGPHGAFTPYPTCRAFRAALNAGHFRYAVVTDTRVQWFHAYSPTPQERWMRGDPHARQILPVGHPTWPIEVWQLSGPLSLNC